MILKAQKMGEYRFLDPSLEPEDINFGQNQSSTLNYTIKDEKSTINMGGYLSKKKCNTYLKIVRA